MCPGGQKRANGGVLYAKFCLLQAYFCSLWRSSSAAACRRPRLLPNERAILGWAGGRRCPCGLKPVALRLKLTAIKPRNLPLWPKPPVATPLNPRYIFTFLKEKSRQICLNSVYVGRAHPRRQPCRASQEGSQHNALVRDRVKLFCFRFFDTRGGKLLWRRYIGGFVGFLVGFVIAGLLGDT